MENMALVFCILLFLLYQEDSCFKGRDIGFGEGKKELHVIL